MCKRTRWESTQRYELWVVIFRVCLYYAQLMELISIPEGHLKAIKMADDNSENEVKRYLFKRSEGEEEEELD